MGSELLQLLLRLALLCSLDFSAFVSINFSFVGYFSLEGQFYLQVDLSIAVSGCGRVPTVEKFLSDTLFPSLSLQKLKGV